MLADARQYFGSQNVLEPEVAPAHAADGVRYLQSSPEFAMKRMLAAGFPDIYFIGKVFRDGEAGCRHQPEFTMIEWYRLGFDLEAIVNDGERLMGALLGDGILREPAVRLSYCEAFERYLGVDPLSADVDLLADVAGADASLRQSIGRSRDAWLDLLLATKVAPLFPRDRLVTLYHYPASQAALSQLEPKNPRFARRFEFFAGDLEIANGYVELTDPKEQRRRIEEDRQRRASAGRPAHEADERLLAALDAGLPACAGIALGLDRLLMLALNANDIRDVRHFCWETA